MYRNSMMAAPAASVSGPSCPPTPYPPAPSLTTEDGVWISSGSQNPPSLSQLLQLTSLPANMASAMRSKASRNRGRRKGALVREAQIVSKVFDGFGSRPEPTNGLHLEQTVQLELQISTSAAFNSPTTIGASSYYGVNIALSNFAAQSTLTTVFDQYRIDQLEAWIECPTPNLVGTFPQLYSAVDLDDSNTPTSVGQVADHLGSISTTGPAGHYHKWKPHVALAAYSGAFTSYCNAPSQWIDSASPNVQHYGLKIALNSNSTVSVPFNLTLRAVVSLRAPSIN